MNQRIDFTKLEGFPLTQDTLDFMQKSYRDSIAAVAGLMGNLVIVTGVADLGANWGDGWVVINGELLPFVGGVKAARVIVEEIFGTETFANASVQTVLYTRRARLASVGGDAFADFVRLDTIKNISLNQFDTGWINTGVVMAGGWNNIDFEYRRIGKLVKLRGSVSSPNPNTRGSVALTMPAGVRPQKNTYAVVGSSQFLAGPVYFVHVDVFTGEIRVYEPGYTSGNLTSSTFTADGIEFYLP